MQEEENLKEKFTIKQIIGGCLIIMGKIKLCKIDQFIR
jgi:hypothetical protein